MGGLETELELLEVTLERTRGGGRNRAGAYFFYSEECTLGWWKLEKKLLEVTLERIRQVVLSQHWAVQCIKQVEAGNGPEGATWAK